MNLPPIVTRPAFRFFQWGSRAVELDLRSLAVMRIGLGIILLLDLVVAVTNAEAFYSDAGVLTREMLFEKHWHHPWAWSLHTLSGSVKWQYALLSIALLASVAFTLGWRTRLATLISWILICSLENRNSAIINGADPVIRLLLFWSLFLPIGKRWSVDSRGQNISGVMVKSLPGLALMLQISFVYWFSFLLKTDPVWHTDATALWQVLHADVFTRPLGLWIRVFPDLCIFLTRATLELEIWGPMLIFIPFARTPLRLLAIASFWLFHAGIQACMDIGSFPWVMAVAWSALLPSAVWRWGGRLLRRTPSPALPYLEPATPWRWGRDLCCGLCLTYALMWNLRTTDFKRWEPYLPRETNGIGFLLRLDQFWTMFAPFPWLDDGWFLFPATLTDGSEVDLMHPDRPLTLEKPYLSSRDYKDARWQKYLTNLWVQEQQHHRQPFARYWVDKWNREHGALAQVQRWEFIYMLERTWKDSSRISVPRKVVLARSPVPAINDKTTQPPPPRP